MGLDENLENLHAIDREYRHLEKAVAVLQWDQETYLPSKGVEERAEQLAVLQRIAHERLASTETGRLLKDLGSSHEHPSGDPELPSIDRDFLKVMRRNYDRAVQLPGDFVSNAARAVGLSQAAWAEARRNNDFPQFLPHLKTMIAIAQKKAEYWGFKRENAYDGLLDSYEPNMTAQDITAVFRPLQDRLVSLLRHIAAQPQPDNSFLKLDYDTNKQVQFNRLLLEHLGFDTNRGRLDISVHPFTTSLGFDDIRITTRYFKNNLLSSIFSVIHESGHAFYELGFPRELQGTCLADGASMAVHESQSRFWENVIGRSRSFWETLFPKLQAYFPEQLQQLTVNVFYQAVNYVHPSLIRVDADEVSYSLHIILRFELEKQLFSGTLAPEDLPEVWRRQMKDLLGVEPETDADGVLQDVHWSMGAFGYFPSYALGNLYGLQIRQRLLRDLPNLDELIAQGWFEPVHHWLQDQIYVWGRRLDPAELLSKLTGEKLSPIPFIEYLEAKYKHGTIDKT
ncbi:MAG: carboxypeptidase M32 [Treponema sp.]|jgi:carboxypeptidase Taq|nr:carboxypeptidase M32 [Treponema sp.]